MSVVIQSQKEVQPEVASVSRDYTAEAVPLSERKDPVTMGLLWITMVTGFPSVLVGFAWFKEGLNLPQVIGFSLVSCLLLLAYCLPACMLGSQTGLTYALLSRKVFGRWGSRVVSLNLAWLSIVWYGLTAVLLAEGLKGLYNISVPLVWLSAGLAFVMAFNNFFGFNGVANFARYLAGPVLVLWVGYTFIKAGASCPPQVWSEPSHAASPLALGLVSTFVIGYSVWGNEADYWRFGKPRLFQVTVPIVIALAIGEFLFPVTGWMLARTTGITDYAAATALMNTYAFGGLSVVAAIVLAVTYFAVNDSSLYGAVNALQNVHPIPRRRMVGMLASLGAVTAAVLSGIAQNFEDVASVSCIFLPSATIVILAEHWLISKWHKVEGELSRVPAFADLPPVRWSAIVAFAVGCSIGVVTTGMIPGTEMLRVGVPALQAWVATLVIYVVLRRIEQMREQNQSKEQERA
jgi:cytosine permease